MNILVISYYYSWSSSVGSRRMQGLVKGLVADGHHVTVVGALAPSGVGSTAPGTVILIETPATDRVITARRLVTRIRRVSEVEPAATASPTNMWKTHPRRWVRRWIAFPDTMWEWTYRAQQAARASAVRPDVIIASAPPMAALHAASKLARHFRCPWIADMRDLWTGDPYRVTPPSVRWLDRRLERRVLSSASAITTVAVSLAEELHDLCPHIAVTPLRNGFDEEWLRSGDVPPGKPATVVYTGTLTSNTGRTLESLCNAADVLRAMKSPASPQIDIVGAVDRSIVDLVGRRRLTGIIRFRGVVDAGAARTAQQGASALLNFSWENPRDFGKLPAKIFEYAAARRPIIHLGKVATLGTELIREHSLGFVVDPDDPVAVARLILGLADRSVAWVPPSAAELAPLSQQAMVAGFREVIEKVSRDRS